VKSNVNGFLVEPKHPEAIAERILQLNNDKPLRQKLGEGARNTILERYTIDKVIKQYEETYEKVLGE
jgi:glycosyltransferase involved in cell wall biosynthesis